MHELQNWQSAFLTTFTLVVTLTFHLLTSKSNQLISITTPSAPNLEIWQISHDCLQDIMFTNF